MPKTKHRTKQKDLDDQKDSREMEMSPKTKKNTLHTIDTTNDHEDLFSTPVSSPVVPKQLKLKPKRIADPATIPESLPRVIPFSSDSFTAVIPTPGSQSASSTFRFENSTIHLTSNSDTTPGATPRATPTSSGLSTPLSTPRHDSSIPPVVRVSSTRRCGR